MAKDPAFLFYFRDFLVSTELMTAEEVGLYIRILCHMADKGRLTKEHMQSICKAHGIAQALHNKLKVDENGLFYNTRLEEEVIKRSNYTQSRRENAKHMHKHMGNANINANDNVIKEKGVVRGEFDFELLWAKYPNKDGKRAAERHFNCEVKTEQDWKDINTALDNYIQSDVVKKGFIKNGSTWFNNWRDWIVPPKKEANDGIPKQFRHLVSKPFSIGNQREP